MNHPCSPATATWPVVPRAAPGPDAPAPPHSTGQLLVPILTGHQARAAHFRRTDPTATGVATLRPASAKCDPTNTVGSDPSAILAVLNRLIASWRSAGMSNSASRTSFAAAQSIFRGSLLNDSLNKGFEHYPSEFPKLHPSGPFVNIDVRNTIVTITLNMSYSYPVANWDSNKSPMKIKPIPPMSQHEPQT
ncbi:hypothetical protein T265_00667 [Opisthorchis viverrini]|uniref:Uncharacterized protein n=1 Tax=Opisthorchis viverrini TaxID=6198 RepID=A0A075A2H4_OPIVI|nr:hypothetical protein T265_00667 [Opisthorchis viverrini]KER33566.1 hypothetical protein T265_00667 [Opisthorchis viverrini]